MQGQWCGVAPASASHATRKNHIQGSGLYEIIVTAHRSAGGKPADGGSQRDTLEKHKKYTE